MPQSHEQESHIERSYRSDLAASKPLATGGREHEPHEDVIADPGGKGDMPPVPEVVDVSRQEGETEIFRSANTEHGSDSDREGAVPRKIEEEIERIGIHVRNRGPHAVCALSRFEPVRLDEGCHEELVGEAPHDVLYSGIDVGEQDVTDPGLSQVTGEAAESVDRTRRNCREEEEKQDILPG